VVVVVGAVIDKGVPIPILAPPQLVAQFNVVPLPPVADREIFVYAPAQNVVWSAVADVGATGTLYSSIYHPGLPGSTFGA
jgi:hypothetical protein